MKYLLIITLVFTGLNNLKSQSWHMIPNCDSLDYNASPEASLAINFMKEVDNILYVTGGFDSVIYGNGTNINARVVTTWNGNEWGALEGTVNGTLPVKNGIWADDIKDIIKFDNKIFFGGAFQMSSPGANICAWTGTEWYRLSEEPTGSVTSIQEYTGEIYVSGGFGYIGTTLMPVFAVFDGTDWHASTMPQGESEDMVVFRGELYAGGYFTQSGGHGFPLISTPYIARFDGTSWKNVGMGTNCWVEALTVDTFNTFLYAGGCFSRVYQSDGSYMLVDGAGLWDGYRWHKVGYGNCFWDVRRKALAVYRGDLYYGMQGGSDSVEYYCGLARWDGEKWDSLSHGVGAYDGTIHGGVNTLEVYNDTLWVGGTFHWVDGNYIPQGLAKWFMPDTSCNYLKPLVYSLDSSLPADTFYLSGGQAEVQFYNNNPYVDSWSWDFGDTGTDTVKDPLHIYTDTGSYNVSVTVSHNGCVKTAEKTVYIQYPLNVSELKDKEPGFKLYPNPTSNTLFIEITPAYAKAMAADGLRVIDIKGNEVFSMSLQKEKEKYSIDISGLRKGVYFVKIGDESQRFVKN